MRFVLGLAAALALMPVAGWAQSSEAQQREACTGDVMQFCSAYIPDRQQIAGCLAAKRSQISPACRSAIGGGQKGTGKRETRRKRRS